MSSYTETLFLTKHLQWRNGGTWKKKIKAKPSSFEHVNRWRGSIWVSPENVIGERSFVGVGPCTGWRNLSKRFSDGLQECFWTWLCLCCGFGRREKGKWWRIVWSSGWESNEEKCPLLTKACSDGTRHCCGIRVCWKFTKLPLIT